ncbi:hypothetical protein DXG03_004108 [Asterophora parasitica]|uniref:NADP-dependent oxidoreductase domain-containing protein n=1 Tax=Asterophora parasitica TaxID=117018 RepID=A0A9P7KA96_9AGAR|nr:hypothetical protein DXG03_004108 [Asterophora parasitica]
MPFFRDFALSIQLPLPYNPADSITEQIASSFQNSLTNLKTTYLDSYLLHSPCRTLEQTLEAWRALIALQNEGKVRMIGICNAYDVSLLHALSRERQVQAVQNRWYEENDWDASVHSYCRANDVMYQSFWTLTGSPSLLTHPTLLELAAAAACTPAQVVYKIAQLEGIVPLSGTTSTLHMQQDITVNEIELPAESNAKLGVVRNFIWG